MPSGTALPVRVNCAPVAREEAARSVEYERRRVADELAVKSAA